MKVSPRFNGKYYKITQYRGQNPGVTVYFIGWLAPDLKGAAACGFLENIFVKNGRLVPEQDIASRAKSLSGNFLFVIHDGNEDRLLACVDRIRSYPLFYRESAGRISVGADPDCLLENVRDHDPSAFLEFKMAGYVLNDSTLSGSVRQIPAGSYLYIDKGRCGLSDYFSFYSPVLETGDKPRLMEQLHQNTVLIFKRLIDRLGGRPVWIPLSAGLDSRLVVCFLNHLGYKNLQTFSYGIPGNWDAAGAEKISKALGVPWMFIPYSREGSRDLHRSRLWKEYLHFAHAVSAAPFVQDIYALRQLVDKRIIPRDAVVINGQTGDFISGNHIPAVFTRARISKDLFFDAVMRKHFALWTNLLNEENISLITAKLLATSPGKIESDMDNNKAMKLFEFFEWRNRQAKYVVNGQRVYDFFGIDWELPLWDDPYLDFWQKVPLEYKFKQSLYREYLASYDFCGLFNKVNFPRHDVPGITKWAKYPLRIIGRRRRALLLDYWKAYSYLYALYPYREYLKTAGFHRGPISYLVKYLLENEYGEFMFR